MNNNTPLILPFNKIRATDLPLVGGKGANLGEMTHAGFPIPDGFCLTTAAFQQFINAYPNADDIYRQLDNIATNDIEAVRSVGQHIRETLLNVPIPAEIAEAVKKVWQETGTEHAYAVRSSATAEDLPDASFAGQQDTYLNIIGEESLLDAIRRCWVSLFTDRAILYRAQNNFPHREVALSVVVQQMVMSEKSGTLFTADPLTGHRHTLTIDASFGLGEALVSGLVSPDSYRVDKRTRVILDRQIADKQIGIFPEKDGGTRQERLSEVQRVQTVLNDEQILALTDLGSRIEAHYGSPQDIEWAITGDEVHLLQSRPITSLYPIEGLKSPDDSLHIYFSMGHQQNMTNAMAPLSLSSFQQFEYSINKNNSIVHISGGRMFADITLALRHPILRKLIPALLSQFDALAPQVFQVLTQRPEFKRPNQVRFSPSVLKGLFKMMRRVFSALWRDEHEGFVERTNTLIDDFIEETASKLRAHPIGKAQIQATHDTLPEMPPFFLNWVPEAAAGIAATRILPRLARRYLSHKELEALTLGIYGNVVNDMNFAIGDLADLARQTPELAGHFDKIGDDAHAWLEEASKIEGSAPFFAAWEDFLDQYGSRAPSEIDIHMPRWIEDPLPVLRVIAGNMRKNESTRARFEAQEQAREAAFAHLMSVAHGPRARLMKRLYYTMTKIGGMREHHKFMMVRFVWVVKQILKENASQLISQ
ncbi:MAG: PEP/pyruvate-binding domain-containing protein, partial [Anaerolineales bacterium]|nr:PEP/pyruvate-binding domain-containing protein [Anaerolineales bacterium]